MAVADQVLVRLHKALEGGALPPQGQKIGQRLMSQLHRPTRIAVIGLPGAGKSRLINLLTGADLMPDLAGVSAVEITFGEEARSQFTQDNGTIAQAEGHPAAGALPQGTQRLALLCPDERLRGRSYTEINLTGSPKSQIDTLDWMAERTDIAIWCSAGFDERERALWSAMPDQLKDNSFLALTRADRLFMKGALDDQIARLTPIVADEFRCLYPVATLQAAAARNGDTVINAPLWRSSGGMALVEGINERAEQARTSALDHAFMLLERFKVPGAEAEAPAAAVPAAIAPAAIAPAAQPRVVPAPVSLAPPPAVLRGRGEVLQKAMGVLRGCADELIASSEPARGETTDRILERCNATAQDLVQLLSESDDADGEIEALREDALEGEQMLMLLRLERGDTAAEDSLTVLLQMKKELAQRIAR